MGSTLACPFRVLSPKIRNSTIIYCKKLPDVRTFPSQDKSCARNTPPKKDPSWCKQDELLLPPPTSDDAANAAAIAIAIDVVDAVTTDALADTLADEDAEEDSEDNADDAEDYDLRQR